MREEGVGFGVPSRWALYLRQSGNLLGHPDTPTPLSFPAGILYINGVIIGYCQLKALKTNMLNPIRLY